MFRIRKLCLPALPALAIAAACSSSNTPAPATADPSPPVAPPLPPPRVGDDRTAVSLGVTIDARDDAGAPRLVRAIIPRAGGKGMTADQAARDHLAALAPLWLSHQRAADLTTHSVQRLRNGASVVRLQQQIGGIDVHQAELRVLVDPDGALAAVSGSVLPAAGRIEFTATATAAVDRALDALYGAARGRPAITETLASGTTTGYREVAVAAAPDFSVQHARVKREILIEDGKPVSIWAVELLAETTGPDHQVEAAARRFLIADADGRLVREVNLTANDSFVYRALAEPTGNRIPLDGPLQSFSPHPTGVPDGSLPDLGPYNLVVMEAFNGPHDPWLGTMATTTTGNNVDAYADIALPRGFGPGDIRPDVRGGRTLNHRYDFTAEPLATPEQSKAAAVNVFFVTNWLHDWYYDSGFTEATGNAQLDNFGRGGVGGDPLVARAQANALGGSRNNANMSTPADGLSPIMNMFLWTGAVRVSLTTPQATIAASAFVPDAHHFEVTGSVVLVEDLAGGTHSACGPVTGAVAGKIALVELRFDRLECLPGTALDNVKAAGAIGVIATLATPGSTSVPVAGSAAANLPGVVIGFDDGVALEAALPTTATLRRADTLEHDGDFDNALIAHEWGHYLHHRLASCETAPQCFAMSEGWGDFNALLMMLRPNDDRAGSFAWSVYAASSEGFAEFGSTDPGYFGLRRYPYSTNRANNALSLRHIGADNALPDVPSNPEPVRAGNSEVHNAGEVWAESLWEVYNVLIDAHGVVEAHRRMTDYIVAGLLLTPPEATYVEGRDAVLAAAGALDTDDMLLMAAAFAGRGSGSCAVAPSRSSIDLAGVVESGTVAARLEASAATLIDDGASCDHDGYLDPGESGSVRLTIANGGVVAAEDVVVTATTAAPGVTFGKPIRIASIAAQSQLDIAIPVQLAATAPTNANLDIAIRIDGNVGCNTGTRVVELHERMGVDEVATTTDTLEARRVVWTPTGATASEIWHRAEVAGTNHVLFGADAGSPSDTQIVSPVLQVSPTAPFVVTLNHAYDLEAQPAFGQFFDGGVVELSSDGGATWRDVSELGVDAGYPAQIGPFDPDNPLRGRRAFSGTSPAFPALQPLVLDFGTQLAGQVVQIRFRIGTDRCCAASGWTLDDIAISGITNTPFTGLVPEPTRCTASAPATAREIDDSGVLESRHAPHRSLAGVPGATDAP